jgi:importin-4
MKSEITPTTEPLLELFYQALSDDDSEVQCNAAFAVGLLVEHSQKDLSPQYLHLLSALHPLLEVPTNSPVTRWKVHDNAVGAVSRLIVRNAAAVPLDQVLPVLINALPLRHDFLENPPVFKAIFHLFGASPQALHPYSDRLLEVFRAVLEPSAPDQIDDETRAGLIELIGALNKEAPEKVQAAGLGPFVPGE